MPTPLRILFAGSGAFGLPTLGSLREQHEVVHVYTQPDRPAGRGKKLTPTPIGLYATAHGLPLTRTDDLNAESLPPADALVVIAFGQKISQAVTRHPQLGAINLHASLLPRHRGAAPIHHALLQGDTVVGNSVIRLANRMDAGAVLGQATLQVRPAETTGELHDRLAEAGAPLVLKVIEELAAGTAVEKPQDSSRATLAGKLSREDAVLDFTRPAREVVRRINALSPWPGCQVRLIQGGEERDLVTLLKARPAAPGSEAAEPGEIVENGTVACAGGTRFDVLDIQSRGRKPMSLTSYRNGKLWTAGMRVAAVIPAHS